MQRADEEVRYDVAIAGGGPAGAAAAILLVRAGLRVALVDAGCAPERIEGAGVRLVAVLKAQGMTLEGIGPPMPRHTRWGGEDRPVNREHAVLRPVFDAALRRQAADEGVRVVAGLVERVRPGCLRLASGEPIGAGLVVEARGRRAPVGAERLRGPATVAIGGFVEGAGEDGAGSAVAARPNGWSWSIGAPDGRIWRQVTLDAVAVREGIAAGWSAVDAGPLPKRPVVRAAELRLAAPVLDPALLRIGDAAVAMDPLSGHGLFWALASALHAVPMAFAMLSGDIDKAARFHRERVVETFFRQARVGRDLHRASGLDGPFWRARCGWPPGSAAHEIPDTGLAGMGSADMGMPAGVAAGTRTSAAPHVRRRIVVRDARLAEADVLVTAQDPGGVAFVNGREIVPILARAGRGPLPDRETFAARLVPEIPADEAGRIHDWLVTRGVTTADLAAMPALAGDPTAPTQEVTR